MGQEGGRARRSYWWAFVELFALSGVAITQPYLDLVGRNSEVLVTHDASWFTAGALALLVALVPAAVAVFAEWLVGLVSERAVPWLHAALCGGLIAVLVVQVVKPRTSFGPRLLLASAIVAAVVAGTLVLRYRLVRTFLHWLALAAAVFVPLFLFASPATDVLDAAADGPATSPGVARTPHRVVLVVLDELPTISLLDGTGHIDRQLFPHLAALADDSIWYRNHTAVAGFTAASVPAILSGEYPNTTKFGTYDNYPDNLFTLIGDASNLNVHEAVTRLCPSKLCPAAGGVGRLFDTTFRLWRESASPERAAPKFEDRDAAIASIDTGEAFVRSLRPTHGLHLDMVHLELPHYPWERLGDLRRYTVPETPPAESYPFQPWSAVAPAARIRHLLQLQAADTIVGRIQTRLRQIGQYDDSMVVLTADHGIAFTPGQSMRQVVPMTTPQIMWAPLLVKYPGGTGHGVIDDRPAESVDVVPTITDVVGLPMRYPHPGASLRAAPVARTTRRFYPFFWTAKPIGDARARSAFIDAGTARDFASVVRYPSTPAGGDPRLRPFRIGPYGGLVGRRVADQGRGATTDVQVTVVDPHRLDRLDLTADPLPWVWNEAVVTGRAEGSWFAISADGRILAVAQTVPDAAGRQTLTFLIPPSLVRSGPLRVVAYEVTGPASAPALGRAATH